LYQLFFVFFLDKEFDNYYGVVFTNNNEDKINTSYHLLNTENTEKQHVKVGQGSSRFTFFKYFNKIQLILLLFRFSVFKKSVYITDTSTVCIQLYGILLFIYSKNTFFYL